MGEHDPAAAGLDRIIDRMRSRGVHVVAATIPDPGSAAGSPGQAHLLVRSRRDERIAREELARGGWWVRLGELGAWRLARTVTYLWPGEPTTSLHRGVPSAPLPAVALRGLERAIHARASEEGRADDPSVAVLAAVLAARPGFDRAARIRASAAAASRLADPGEARRLAAAAGVGRAFAWAERAAASPARGSAALLDRGIGAALWPVVRLAARARPPRLRALLLGTPRIGAAPSRTRFAGLELDGGPGVFVPRRMSEPLVDLAVEHLDRGDVMVEVGTGCGAVALAVARARPDVEIHAVDTSAEAIRWARRNASRLGLDRVRFHRGSLLEPVPPEVAGRVGAIVSSVPYVPPGRWGDRDRYGAIEGLGADGLGLPRTLAAQAPGLLRPGGGLLQQLGADQWPGFSEELRALGMTTGTAPGGAAGDVLTWARR
jgi:release factor glutamine methyltransferase